MLTLEKIAWVAIVLGLVIAVTAVIVKPIYNKADEQGKELNKIKFEVSYEGYGTNRYLDAIQRA